MGRWEPNAANRLREAALRLYAEQGYEQTTVAQIAEEAGLTSRTFFRYFGDKREVLFDGADQLEHAMVAAVADAPADAAPMLAVAAALDRAATFLGGHRDWSVQRQAVIAGQPELLERELIKMSRLALALAAGLRDRGVQEPEASLAAEAGVAAFRVAFARWVAPGEDRPLNAVMAESVARLREVTAS